MAFSLPITRDQIESLFRSQTTVNIKSDFGAKGDGTTNDTAAFKAARDLWKSTLRTNPAPGANSNKLGSIAIVVPPGDYLITEAGAMLDSAFTTRSVSMEWIGTGWQGGTQILYQPASPGALFYNNDAVVAPRFRNISFDCNSASSDFVYSTSAGGPQRYMFDYCTWTGAWQYLMHLAGSNNNSENTWNDPTISGVTCTAVVFSETSDQFLNFWFNHGSVTGLSGNLFKMTKGGHVKIIATDISGYSPSSDNYLVSLEGSSHSQGVCSFSMKDSRVEMNNAHALLLYCEWPQGDVLLDNIDMGSQSGQAWGTTIVPVYFTLGNTPGPSIRFSKCQLMGIHKYRSANSNFTQKKSISYEQCDAPAFRDFYDTFDLALDSGGNIGGLPVIATRKCRGAQERFDSVYTAWVASTTYAVNDVRSAYPYLYKCTSITTGIAGTDQPYGAGVVVDGGVTWTSQDIFPAADYVTDGGLGWDKARNAGGSRKIAIIRGGGGVWPQRVSATVPGNDRAVLPPNSLVQRVYMSLPAGVLSQGSPGSYKVLTDEASPTTFLNFTSGGNLSAGFTQEWTGSYNTGTTLKGRAIVLRAMTDVTQGAAHPAVCQVEYVSGD